jgi:hypothetical protein
VQHRRRRTVHAAQQAGRLPRPAQPKAQKTKTPKYQKLKGGRSPTSHGCPKIQIDKIQKDRKSKPKELTSRNHDSSLFCFAALSLQSLYLSSKSWLNFEKYIMRFVYSPI